MLVKKHINDGKLILAICDAELIGKKFIQGEFILDMTSIFYKGEPKDQKEISNLIRASYIINAVGKKTIKLLIDENFMSKEDIKTISGVPHIQIVFDEKINENKYS